MHIMRSPKKRIGILSLLLASLAACVEPNTPDDDGVLLVDTRGRFEHSTQASNLMTTAIQKELDADMVFFPSEALREDTFALVEKGQDPELVKRRVMRLYAGGVWDELTVGTMRGSAIREFILERTIETGRHDLQVAGIRYSIRLVGGLPTIYQVQLPDGSPLDDRRRYRIAVSSHALDGVFPGYEYRHGFNRSFRREQGRLQNGKSRRIYASKLLATYIGRIGNFANYIETRSNVIVADNGTLQEAVTIAAIQGVSHISPLLGRRVTTQGVVTAAGENEAGGFDLYLQSQQPDADPRTSEGILVHVDQFDRQAMVVGNVLKVSGVVYEDQTQDELTRTSLRQVTDVALIAENQSLPEPVVIGHGDDVVPGTHREVPNHHISTHNGNVNQKTSLNLEDGLDFWESLEGMRLRVRTPRVVGLGGGRKDFGRQVNYLNLFIVGQDTETESQVTPNGGLILDLENRDFNPEIVKIIDHQFSDAVRADQVFKVGDRFEYDLEGVFGFDVNTFGGGEYVFYVTGRFESTSQLTSLAERGTNRPGGESESTELVPTADQLTVASFNVENLFAAESERIKNIGSAIQINLQCPDIVNLVEIQDFNGDAFWGKASAAKTLERVIQEIRGCSQPVDYKFLNIDPIQNQEGGEPGGNIRVAMLYNSLRVNFERRGQSGPADETYLSDDGSLSLNPGRIYPLDKEFEGTRRSLVAEFEFAGEQIFVIGNHFNSKGGDTSLWAAEQPPYFGSERERSAMASRINDFTEMLLTRNPRANIVVVGDFNDFDKSQALKILQGETLTNLMHVLDASGEPLVPVNDRYSYNYGGNSQALDFVLTSRNLLEMSPEMDVVHINTDYMGQVADHDPVVSRFSFRP
jgi:hypothetical protein